MFSGVLIILSFKWLTDLIISSLLMKKFLITKHFLLTSLKFLSSESLTNTFWKDLLKKEALLNSYTIRKLFSLSNTGREGVKVSFDFT